MYWTGFSIHKWILSPTLTFKLIRFDLKQSGIKYSPHCQADEMIILSEIIFNFTSCHKAVVNNLQFYLLVRRIPDESRQSSSPSGERASIGSKTTNGGPVNALCNLSAEGFCHLERSQEETCQWQMKDFFSRCGFEISSNARLCLSVCFHRDDAIWWRWPPPPTPPVALSLSPSHSVLHVYFLATLTLSCYPAPFCSLSHSSSLTGLITGLLNPFRTSGGICLMARCLEKSQQWPCSTILWIWILFSLFGVFFFLFLIQCLNVMFPLITDATCKG